MKTTTVRIVAVAASTALALTACGGDQPSADPTATTPVSSTTTSTPSPSTTATASTTASSVKATQEAAAIALVRTYIAEYNKSLTSGSTTAFRATFTQTCAVCLSDANPIDEAYRNKQRLRGLEFAVASLRVTFHNSREIFVEGKLSQAGGEVLTASGAVAKSFKPTAPFGFLWRVKPGLSPAIFGSEKP